jgi:aminopeptidase YwaD
VSFKHLKGVLFAIILLATLQVIYAQDLDYARHIADTLSSGSFDGRGYVNDGSGKAAIFLSSQFEHYDLKPFGSAYLQEYSFPMNTFPGKVEVIMDGKSMVPGREFQVWAASPSMSNNYKIVVLKGKDITKPKRFIRFSRKDYSNHFVLVDKKGINDKKVNSLLDSLKYYNFLKAKGLIYVTDQKLSWSVMIGFKQRAYPVVDLSRSALKGKPRNISLKIDSKFIKDYRAKNVAAYIKGSVQPDSFLVFTAHYDHLGRMGSQAIYPGANDNASGTAMVLDLARHYSRAGNQPYYSIAFVLFSGEEAGLHGSNWFADHPLFDLKKVKFLVNLDMVGTGSEGITMVNATSYKDAYQRMVKINTDNEYLMTVKERGESCNSDHCPFYKKGVPSIFIYSMGKELTEYHNPDDNAANLPMTEYKDIFRLVRDFMDSARNW